MVFDPEEFAAKARENLAVMRAALAMGAEDAAVSRGYYGAFQAAVWALIARTSYRPSRWDHGDVQARVASEFIGKRHLLPGQHRSTLMELMGKRHMADYGPGRVSSKQAIRLAARAEEFCHCLGVVPGPEAEDA